jgi:hypothetical protein
MLFSLAHGRQTVRNLFFNMLSMDPENASLNIRRFSSVETRLTQTGYDISGWIVRVSTKRVARRSPRLSTLCFAGTKMLQNTMFTSLTCRKHDSDVNLITGIVPLNVIRDLSKFELYPAVGLDEFGTKIRANFGVHRFLYEGSRARCTLYKLIKLLAYLKFVFERLSVE